MIWCSKETGVGWFNPVTSTGTRTTSGPSWTSDLRFALGVGQQQPGGVDAHDGGIGALVRRRPGPVEGPTVGARGGDERCWVASGLSSTTTDGLTVKKLAGGRPPGVSSAARTAGGRGVHSLLAQLQASREHRLPRRGRQAGDTFLLVPGREDGVNHFNRSALVRWSWPGADLLVPRRRAGYPLRCPPAPRPAMHHAHPHAFASLLPRVPEGLTVSSRRNFLKAGLAGLAGLSLPALLRRRAEPPRDGGTRTARASSSCGWPAAPATSTPGTPSPTGRRENRGPFGVIPPECPASSSASICRSRRPCSTASRSSARSMPAHSNHEPNTVFQTGNLEAAPRDQPAAAELYPAIGSIVAKHHGPNHPAHAAPTSRSCGRGRTWPSPATSAQSYDPFIANHAARLPIYTWSAWTPARSARPDLFRLPPTASRPSASATAARCCRRSTAARRPRPAAATSTAMDRYGQQAVEHARRPAGAGGVRPVARARGGPGALRQASVVPAGAAGPAAGRGGRRLRHARSELPHRPRAPGTRTATTSRPTAASARASGRCCRCSITCSRRWWTTWTSAACSTTCW